MGAASTIQEFIVTVAFWAAVVVFIIGLFMIVAPDQIIRMGQRLNRWIPTEAFFNRLDAPRYGERFFYRHHILFGIVIALGGMYIFYRFVFAFNADAYALPVFTSRSANEWLTGSLVFMNILFSVMIFVIGIIVTLRPSLLKSFEAGLNHWFVTDQSIKKLDIQLQSPDTIFIRRPRLMGLIIMLGSVYILFNLWSMM